jgi:DMSO/TMAO reductase YedYZ molybdopterin-dependent catalytic subunit
LLNGAASAATLTTLDGIKGLSGRDQRPIATAGAPPPSAPRDLAPAQRPIVKPLPDDLFIVHDTNAETRWEALAGQGLNVPIDRFFVRNHTRTPRIDAASWRLQVFGTGLHGAPTRDHAVEFGYSELLAMPAQTITAAVECAGNGRSFFTAQQGDQVSGTPWRLGGIGVARWRGVPLATVLRRAGLSDTAVEVMPSGLDPDYVDDGIDFGPVRRPLPIAKALDDVLLAYEMNGERLPPDHGFPVRVLVPSWVGIASIKWVGSIEVSATPLVSPWNTRFYRLFGPSYPPEGSAPLTNQVVKSAFELPWDATLVAGRTHTLRGRSWSGSGGIRRVEVSVDGGANWRTAELLDPAIAGNWQRWRVDWRPPAPGAYELLARASDQTGATQPDRTPANTFGYLFDAVVRHPVTAG